MSLDLDADVLVTEEAPVTALVQRMGRCNRKNSWELAALGDVLIYQPDDPMPYSPDDLLGVTEFVARLAALEGVSQIDLESAMAAAPRGPSKNDKWTGFLYSGPYADSRDDSFRDGDEFAVPGVLDVSEYQRTPPNKQPGLVLPVPKKLVQDWETPLQRFVLAKAGFYDSSLGRCDEPFAGMGD